MLYSSAMPAIEILGLEKIYKVGFWRKQTRRALHPLHLTVEERRDLWLPGA